MARRVAGKTTGKAGKAAGKSAAKAEPAVTPAVEPAPEKPAAEKVVAPAPAKVEKAPEPVFGDTPEQVYVGKGESRPEYLMLRLTNRHGLVTGATGTGKTVTLQVLAEGLSRAGVPVFAADIKGDLSGVAAMGAAKEPWTTRAKEVGVAFEPDQFPVVFWDLFGEQGHPIRATVSEMGPLLLSRLLDLNDTQEGVLNITFRIADEQGLLLLDLKDLRAMLGYVADNAAKLTTAYGNVSKTSVGAIQRQLLVLENQGGAKFFGEPALAIKDFMRVDRDGRGFINMLAADKLMENPRLYATFLLWLLSEMFEQLPELGDPDKPKLVFFFDEAHLLFNDAPKALLDKIEQVVRLIRSKGVGVYFVTQNPLDVPERVLAQLGNRVQHALRAFTPRDQRAVRAAAETFRQNPEPRHRQGHHRARQGRGAGFLPRRQRRAVAGRPRADPAAVGARRSDHAGGAQDGDGGKSGARQVRQYGRFRIRLRDAAEARRKGSEASRGGATGRRPRRRPRRFARRWRQWPGPPQHPDVDHRGCCQAGCPLGCGLCRHPARPRHHPRRARQPRRR